MDINISTLPCLAPFSSLNARFDTYSICCSSSYIVNEEFAKNKDIWNNFIFRKLRKAMITQVDIPFECKHCIRNGIPNQNFEFNKHAIEKIAKRNIEMMDKDYKITDFQVGYIYVSMDRICNLSCRMCNAVSSTSYEINLANIAYEEFGISNKIPKNTNNTILDIIEKVDLSNLQKIEIQGGELFLSKLFIDIIDKLPNVKLDIITNGTIYNEVLLTKLKRFTNLVLKVSIDGNREVSEYIRCGSSYDTVVDNIKKFSHYLDKAKMEICLTISKYNTPFLNETFKAFTKLTNYVSDIKYHFLIDNLALSIYSFDLDTRKEIIQRLTNVIIEENPLKSKMEEIIQRVIYELKNTSIYDGAVRVNADSFDKRVDDVFHLNGLCKI